MRGLKFRDFADEVEVMSKTTKTTRKPRGPSRPILERVAAGADKILLDIVTHGQVTMDINGTLTRAHPSAAMLAVICKRVKDIKRQQPYTNPAQALADEAARRGLAYPGDGPVGQIGPHGR